MLDDTFQRRREIERMLLSGKKLTIPNLMRMYGVSKNAIRRDLDILSQELPLVSKQGYGGGYFLMEGPSQYQNILSQEQLKCLEGIIPRCTEKEKEIINSMIYEYGPYRGRHNGNGGRS